MSEINQKIIDKASSPGGIELRTPRSASDLQESAIRAEALRDRYKSKIQWLNDIRESVVEQYPSIASPAIKKYKQFIKKYSGNNAMGEMIEDLFDFYEDVLDRTDKNGQLKSDDITLIDKKISNINNLKKEVDDFVSLFPTAEPSLVRETETYEQYNFKKLESEITQNREKVEKLKDSMDKITGSGYQSAFDEKFVRRLTNFGIYIGNAEGKLNMLEKEMARIAGKLESGDMTDDEIQSSFVRLSETANRISEYIKNIAKDIKPSKLMEEISGEKSEQEKARKILNNLADRLEKRAQEKFFTVKDGKKMALELAEKIRQSARGNIKNAMVNDFLAQAENNIFSPEKESDEAHEKMRMMYYYLPLLNKDKEKIEKMAIELHSFDAQARHAGQKVGDLLGKTRHSVAVALHRNNILKNLFDPKEKSSLGEIKENLAHYDPEMEEAEKSFEELLPKILKTGKQEIDLKLIFALSKVNEKLLDPGQKAILDGVKTVLQKSGDVSLEEIADMDEKVSDIIETINSKRKSEMVQEIVEREFLRTGDEESKEREIKYARKPDRVIETKKPEPLPDIRHIEEELPAITKVEVQRSISVMLDREGVIDVEPQKILSFFSETEINTVIDSVKKDVLSNSNKNRDDFNDLFREVLGERILNKLENSKREQMTEVITEQVYSLLRGAVEAESQKEISVLQAGKASKLGKAGSFVARMAPQLAMATGIGIGAGLVIGSGGAAAVVAGASIGLVRVLNKKIAKSEIFKSAKEKAGSFWGNTIGKLFKKEKPPIDNEKVVSEIADKYINKDILASILSNQLRENSSQDLIEQVRTFTEDKNNALRNPTPELMQKFTDTLEETTREFYKNSYNYLLARYPNESEERIAKTAMQMALTMSMYQRNEIKNMQALEQSGNKSKEVEDKYWLVDKMEKLIKFRSEGVGAVLFGGAIGYAVAETSTVGRVVSGALAGAGLGLMIEKKTRMAEDEKLQKTIEKMIAETENKLFGKEVKISENDLAKAKNDSAYIRAKLDMGLFDNSLLLKNRAENFIARVNKITLEKYEAPQFTVDDLLAEVNKQTKKIDKETQKTVKKILRSFDTKGRALVYMGVGAVVGGLAGYAGARLADYLRAPDGETIVPAEKDLGVGATEKGFVGATIYPTERITPPETPLTPIPPETPLKPIGSVEDMEPDHVMELEKVVGHRRGNQIVEELNRAKTARPVGETMEVATKTDDGILELHQVKSASIKNIALAEPVLLTREEALQVSILESKGKYPEAIELYNQSIKHGPIYEDLSTGQQYHADELSFVTDEEYATDEVIGPEKPKPSLDTEEEVFGTKTKIKNPYDEPVSAPRADVSDQKIKIKNPYDEPMPKARASAPGRGLNIENPYEDSTMTAEQIKAVGAPKGMSVEDFDTIMKKIPESGVTSEQYGEMIDVYNKTGEKMASRYIGYVESGDMARAEAVLKLADTVGEPTVQPIIMENQTAVAVEPEPVEQVEDVSDNELTDEQLQAERERIVQEAEEKLKAEEEAQAETEEEVEGEAEEEESLQQQVKEITTARERNLVNELGGANSAKAKENYDWLMKNQDNAKVVKLHKAFVEDMLDDNKIKPSLLKKINVLRESI